MFGETVKEEGFKLKHFTSSYGLFVHLYAKDPIALIRSIFVQSLEIPDSLD